MISAGEFRNGVTFEQDGQVLQVVEFQHVKPGKGAAFVRTKTKNVITGSVVETSYNPTAKFPQAFIERKDVTFHFDVDGADFSSAGEASVKVKKKLRQLGVSPDVIRKVSIAMYEGEINMVIHAEGGVADVTVTDNEVVIVLADKGPGIPDVALAMKEGYSTARDNIRALGFGAGMGLPNMKKYTDSMKIDTEVGVGTTITMTVNL